MKIQLTFSRKKEVNRLRGRLESEGFPRLQMFLLVSITGGVAFLSSYSLLYFGITSMWMRYLLVCIFAYTIFLLLLWLWLRTKFEDYSDLGDISELPNVDISRSKFIGGGREFREGENPVGEALSAAGEAEEFALPLIVLILIITVFLSSAFVIYSAPILFAELLIDTLLAASLYKKMKGVNSQNWLITAIKRTIIPFVITMIVSVVGGFALQKIEPSASSLGDIFYIIKNK